MKWKHNGEVVAVGIFNFRNCQQHKLYCHVYLGYAWRGWRFPVRMIGFISILVTISLNHVYYSAIADIHSFQFTVAHILVFSVSTSRLLATDLNTETITSNHYEVILFCTTNSPWLSSAEYSELTDCIHFSYKHSALCTLLLSALSKSRAEQ
jgi:hypothetical protein